MRGPGHAGAPRETKRSALREPLLAALWPAPPGEAHPGPTGCAGRGRRPRRRWRSLSAMGWHRWPRWGGWLAAAYGGDQPATQEQPDQALFDASETRPRAARGTAARRPGRHAAPTEPAEPEETDDEERPSECRCGAGGGAGRSAHVDGRAAGDARAEERAERLRALQGAQAVPAPAARPWPARGRCLESRSAAAVDQRRLRPRGAAPGALPAPDRCPGIPRSAAGP